MGRVSRVGSYLTGDQVLPIVRERQRAEGFPEIHNTGVNTSVLSNTPKDHLTSRVRPELRVGVPGGADDVTLFVLLRVKQHDDTPATHKQVHWGEHHLLPAPSPGSTRQMWSRNAARKQTQADRRHRPAASTAPSSFSASHSRAVLERQTLKQLNTTKTNKVDSVTRSQSPRDCSC